MTKAEIKNAADHELVADLVRSFASLVVNYNTGRGTKVLDRHCNDLEAELLKRGLLTQVEVNGLNS